MSTSSLSTGYLVLSAMLFALGAFGLLRRRNPLVMLMCVELMLNAVNLTFVTFGRMLNDITGQHVTVEHVWAALDGAVSGPVAEGNAGGGTGMRLFGFKGGIGTASRVVIVGDIAYLIGVLIQGNYGLRQDLLVDGVPVGRALMDDAPPAVAKDGSVIVVIATDAPLSDQQLGGAIMLAEGAAVTIVVFAWLVLRWFEEGEGRAEPA